MVHRQRAAMARSLRVPSASAGSAAAARCNKPVRSGACACTLPPQDVASRSAAACSRQAQLARLVNVLPSPSTETWCAAADCSATAPPSRVLVAPCAACCGASASAKPGSCKLTALMLSQRSPKLARSDAIPVRQTRSQCACAVAATDSALCCGPCAGIGSAGSAGASCARSCAISACMAAACSVCCAAVSCTSAAVPASAASCLRGRPGRRVLGAAALAPASASALRALCPAAGRCVAAAACAATPPSLPAASRGCNVGAAPPSCLVLACASARCAEWLGCPACAPLAAPAGCDVPSAAAAVSAP